MDRLLGLTPTEKVRYAPFHLYTEFSEGHDDFVLGNTQRRLGYSGVRQHIYDLGVDLAKRRAALKQAIRDYATEPLSRTR